MDIKEIYNNLTNVNIDNQKELWDARGKGYYGEYLVFCELYKQISGNCKILMNLDIPTRNGKTTEVDLLLIHETGIYVFEIKHYQGTIYGKDTDNTWTQYFRTVKNSYFKNPIIQNNYHIQSIKKLYPQVPIKSIIVFTNNECNVRVTNFNSNISICLLDDIIKTLEDQFNVLESQFSMEQIDIIFNQLLSYSPMREKVLFNGKEESFFAWIQPTISKLEEKKRELEQEKNNWIESCCKIKKAKIKGIVINIIFAIICVIISTLVVIGFKKAYTIALQQNDAELIEFKQNFLHVDEIGNQYIDCLHDYVSVSNVSLKPLADNAVSFTAQLAMSNDVYGIALTQSSKYIIITYSGKVFEYDVFGDHLYYNRYSNIWGEGIRSYGDLAKAQFYGINIDDISYIKITNIELFKLNINRTIVKDKLEIELFSK